MTHSSAVPHKARAWIVGAVVLVTMGLVACTPPPQTEQEVEQAEELDEAVAAEMATQAPDLVDVTVYFRKGKGPDAFLVPVVREVPVSDDLARTAVELLVAGPGTEDPKNLAAALPTTTRVRSLSVDAATAAVDLSGEVVSDAASVGKRPEHELLALAALANTLTEFPEIDRVRLTVEGKAARGFWGGWGLPRVLLRDDSVVAPAVRGAVPDLAGFARTRQQVGAPRRPRPVVTSVGLRPRSTYVRVTLELTDANGEKLVGAAPRSVARRRGNAIVLTVAARAAPRVTGNRHVDDPALRGTRIRIRRVPPAINVTVRPARRNTAFSLRTLNDPARVVLDIRR